MELQLKTGEKMTLTKGVYMDKELNAIMGPELNHKWFPLMTS